AHKPTIPASTPGDAYYVEEFGFSAIMNAGRDYGASEYGGEWFRIALHEIGHLLGVIHSYDIPSVMGSGSSGAPGGAVFPGHHGLVHLQRLHRPDSTDIDMYRVEVPEGGRLTAEINAERRATD